MRLVHVILLTLLPCLTQSLLPDLPEFPSRSPVPPPAPPPAPPQSPPPSRAPTTPSRSPSSTPSRTPSRAPSRTPSSSPGIFPGGLPEPSFQAATSATVLPTPAVSFISSSAPSPPPSPGGPGASAAVVPSPSALPSQSASVEDSEEPDLEIAPEPSPPGLGSSTAEDSDSGSSDDGDPGSSGAGDSASMSSEPVLTSTASPSPAQSAGKRCQRDISRPRPKLGKSQRRYAIAVLASASAVAVASLLYSGVYSWVPRKMFSSWRIFSIIVARLLVLISIRVSAALVASITKASPEDGALDASGAFLTWGSAIFTRLYSEGAVMTMTAFGCIHHTSSWNDKLKKYINRYETSPTLQSNWYDEGSLPGVPPMSHAAQNVGLDYEDNEDDEDDSSERLYLFKRIFGGRWERKLLLVIAVAYFIEEIAVLVLNVLSLVGSFESNNAIFFTPDDEPGQCAIGPDDLRVLALTVFLQCLYAISNQPSLVPLLTLCALRSRTRYRGVNKALERLRWALFLLLVIWVVSLLVLPLTAGTLEPFFIAGDISLFWFVIMAPPAYSSISYIITAIYTCIAASAGVVLVWRIAQNHGKRKIEEAATSGLQMKDR